METGFNEYETNCNEQSFKVRGHDVKILSPNVAKITVRCPWNRPDPSNSVHQSFVMNQCQFLVNYLVAEDMLKQGAGIILEAKYQSEL